MKFSRALVLVAVGTDRSRRCWWRRRGPPRKAKTAQPPAIKHVFVVNLENKNYDETFGPDSPATYLSKDLAAKGALLEQYFAIGHVSLDNYIAEITGQGPSKQTQIDCFTYNDFVSTGTGDLGQALGDGCVYPTSVKTIADQIAAKQLTWKGYMEDMSSPCLHPAIGEKDPYVVAAASNPSSAYATRHNPFVYFHSIVDSPSCEKNVVRAHRARARPGVDEDHTELLDDHTQPVQRRTRQHVSRRQSRRARVGQHVVADVGAEDPRVPRVQEGRPARRDVRRGRGHGRHR